MNINIPITYFDSPYRVKSDALAIICNRLASDSLLNQLLDSTLDLVFIIDKNRQIIALNSAAQKALTNSDKPIFGSRLGEILDCIHAHEEPSGCGTTKYCALCGMANSIKNTRDTQEITVDECRIIRNVYNKEYYEVYNVLVKPFEYNDQTFYFASMHNIEKEKRKEELERVFFHDVLNTAGAIKGISEIIQSIENLDELENFSEILEFSATQLIEEIMHQRALLKAENGSLEINLKQHNLASLVVQAIDIFRNHGVAKDKHINFLSSNEININTDSHLFIRAFGNILKNALEATLTEGNVTVWIDIYNDYIIVNTKNETIIPENIQLQLFQRSFSTKEGTGRGIGIYSTKLFIEQYLGGKISFISNEIDKTIFSIKLSRN